MKRLFLRSFAIAILGFAAFFLLEFFFEWHRAGYPPWGTPSWVATNPGKMIDVISPFARAYNNILAMLIATIGFAIPLTANMHTPKLIDIFLRDPINRFVLTFITVGAAHILWVDYLIGPEFAPTWAITLAMLLVLVGWALLIPYFFYVVRFIDPSRLIVRLRDASRTIVKQVASRKRDPGDARAEVLLRIGQIGTIIIKALERNDRDVAGEGCWILKMCLDDYGPYKSRVPREWFVVDRADFLGFSDDALEMLSETKCWYEMRCLQQLELGFLQALHGSTDTVSVFSDAVRVVGVHAAERRDDEALRLVIKFFNNFLRESIKSQNLRAVYDVFHQYRKLAKALVDRPERLVEIGQHFVYYAQMARTYGLVFAPQLAIFDLGFITRRAYDSASSSAPELLKLVMSLRHRSGDDVHSMAVKAKLILGGYFVERKLKAEADLLRTNLRDVDGDEIERSEADLLAAERSFFEVTDRQLNLEYIPPDRRKPLQQFAKSIHPRE